MDAGDVLFRGLREVDGEGLALFEKEKQILVLPIDQATAMRLKRLHLGDPMGVTAEERLRSREAGASVDGFAARFKRQGKVLY